MVAVIKQRNGVTYGGLSNQMMTMFGLLLTAQIRRAVVLLPQWRTSYPDLPDVTANTTAVWGHVTWPSYFPQVVDSLSQLRGKVDKVVTIHGFAQLGSTSSAAGQMCHLIASNYHSILTC